jgi:RNA polymerase sigma factor (sigma-70 family)
MSRDAKRIYEELLVRRCQEREAKALGELVACFESRLFYYVRRLVHHEVDAWDVLQKTWAEVFRSIGRLKDAGALRAWVYAVARHVAASHYRPELLLRAKIDPAACAGDVATDDWVPSCDDALDVHEALGRLSLDHREVLALHFLEEMSVHEIAAVLDVPAGTVKSRLFYAKRTLRGLLEREPCHD